LAIASWPLIGHLTQSPLLITSVNHVRENPASYPQRDALILKVRGRYISVDNPLIKCSQKRTATVKNQKE